MAALAAPALATITDADLGYGDPRGVEVLRSALADYLGRVRGVVADPEHIVITNGYTQSLGLVCHALAAAGAKRIALEDPSNPEDALVAAHAGLEPALIGVDEAGTLIDELARADADAVVLTPPTSTPPASCSPANGERPCWPGCARATRSPSRTTTTPSTATTARPSERSKASTLTASSTPARRARPWRRRCASAG